MQKTVGVISPSLGDLKVNAETRMFATFNLNLSFLLKLVGVHVFAALLIRGIHPLNQCTAYCIFTTVSTKLINPPLFPQDFLLFSFNLRILLNLRFFCFPLAILTVTHLRIKRYM